MKIIPYRIVSSATLKQCIFWIAYNQTPLFGNHEDIREGEVEITHRSLLRNKCDEPRLISRAKDQLILCLVEKRLIATGCEGHLILNEEGKLISDVQKINYIHWRSTLSVQNWDDSTIGHSTRGDGFFYSNIEISTVDLFKVFPHEEMEAKLAGHKNGDFFLNLLPSNLSSEPSIAVGQDAAALDKTPKRHDRKQGEPKQSTIESRKADYEKVEHFLKIFKSKGGISKAAKEAARDSDRTWQAFKAGHRHYRDHLKGAKGQKTNSA